MYQLHYYPANVSAAPHMVLEEMGADYELMLVDRTVNAQKSKEYLKLNPNGRIPTLVDGNLVLFEAAAIVLHLLDQNPAGWPRSEGRHTGAVEIQSVADLPDQLASGRADDLPVSGSSHRR